MIPMTKPAHSPLPFLLFCYLLGLALLGFTQGGCGPSTRQKTLSTTLVSVNALRAGFLEFDERHQHTIVESAKSLEDGKAKLAVYRENREPVILAFETAYRMLALASLHKDSTLTELEAAVVGLVTALDQLKKLGQKAEAGP